MNLFERFRQERKAKENALKQEKQFYVMSALTTFYKDLALARGTVELFPYVKAKEVYMQFIKSDEDLNRVYKNLLAYRERMAV